MHSNQITKSSVKKKPQKTPKLALKVFREKKNCLEITEPTQATGMHNQVQLDLSLWVGERKWLPYDAVWWWYLWYVSAVNPSMCARVHMVDFRCYPQCVDVTRIETEPEPVLLLSTLNITMYLTRAVMCMKNARQMKTVISNIPADDSKHSMSVIPQYSNGGKWDGM